jgi:RNA polymerase sigma-70 factor, ECF subfamily
MTSEQSMPWDTALTDCGAGNRARLNALLPELYNQLRDIAARQMSNEHPAHTLQATALVHEAFLKLVAQRQLDPANRSHFLAAAAATMRRLLIDHAKMRKAQKRGGADVRQHPALSEIDVPGPDGTTDLEGLLSLNEALEALAKQSPRAARVVELRFFGGMTVPEVADVLGIDPRTVDADWAAARPWLRVKIDGRLRRTRPG